MTSGGAFLGVTGPFAVDAPWWAEAERVPVAVLRLVTVDGGEGGRDGHVTYHVEALERPAPGVLPPMPAPPGSAERARAVAPPWARADGLRQLLHWVSRTLTAAGRPVTGPAEQLRTWNLAGLFRLPTALGPVWLKAVPRFAASRSHAGRRDASSAWAATKR